MLDWVIWFVLIGAAVAGLVLGSQWLRKRFESKERASRAYRRQMSVAGAALLVALAAIVSFPNDDMRGPLLSFLGILITAVIALSSATLVGNAMAGMMLRFVRGFQIGDYVRIGDVFGRVTEMDLLHVELQTEDRDLMNMPNLHVAQCPVQVMRKSGTILGATVSLGYDVPRQRVAELLSEAAVEAGLTETFVQVVELGDFSITYRIAGLLADVSELLTIRSRLRARMLDSLHGGGVEIVSPTFMNTRAQDPKRIVIPATDRLAQEIESSPDKLVFDKAEEAVSLEKIREKYQLTLGEIKELQAQSDQEPNEAVKEELARRSEEAKVRAERLAELIARRESAIESKD